MFRKIIAISLTAMLLISISACKSETDEDQATASDLTIENEESAENTPSDNSSDSTGQESTEEDAENTEQTDASSDKSDDSESEIQGSSSDNKETGPSNKPEKNPSKDTSDSTTKKPTSDKTDNTSEKPSKDDTSSSDSKEPSKDKDDSTTKKPSKDENDNDSEDSSKDTAANSDKTENNKNDAAPDKNEKPGFTEPTPPSDNNGIVDPNPQDNHTDEQTPPESEDAEYTVTFDFDYDNKLKIEKTTDKVPEIEVSRPGYKFEGWFNSDVKWDFNASIASDIKLTARWEVETYKITYKADGATLPDSNPATYTVEDSALELAPPYRRGRVFAGWMIQNDQGSTVTVNGISKGTTGDLSLVAVWDENSISLGTYEQDGDTSNGKEPIIWIKLKEENGKGYFVSEKILDAKPYNTPKTDVSWQTCTLHKWLNNDFYKFSFTSEDKELIILQDTHTPVNSQTGIGTPVNTKDYVTLLSLEESEELTSYAQRKVKVTPYAKKQGCSTSGNGTGDWWLRSAGCYNDYAAIVQENSGIRENGYSVATKTIGIRPAIWVDMSKLG